MIDLARGYTKYSLNVAFQTSSPNTFKLYQYFSHFRDKKQIQCNVDKIRELLNIEGKYGMPTEIKKKILVPASKELKEKADVWFEITDRITKGRKMIGWKFNIYTKEDKTNSQKTLSIDQCYQYSEEEQKLLDLLIEKYNLGPEQAKKVVLFCQKSEEKKKKVSKILYEIQLQNVNNEIKQSIGGLTVTKLSKVLGISI